MPNYRVAHMFSASTGRMMTNDRLDELEKLPQDELEHHIKRGNVVVRDTPLREPARKPFSEMKKDELEQEVKRRGLEVQGTGSGGNVLVEDMVSALEEAEPQQEE